MKRYQIRRDGEIIYRTNSYLLAREMLAKLHHAAVLEQVVADETIYDTRTHTEARGDDMVETDGTLTLALTATEKATLREIASTVGAYGDGASRVAGRPSITQLIRQIGRGELVVVRPR
jgi:hypothetical protein